MCFYRENYRASCIQSEWFCNIVGLSNTFCPGQFVAHIWAKAWQCFLYCPRSPNILFLSSLQTLCTFRPEGGFHLQLVLVFPLVLNAVDVFICALVSLNTMAHKTGIWIRQWTLFLTTFAQTKLQKVYHVTKHVTLCMKPKAWSEWRNGDAGPLSLCPFGLGETAAALVTSASHIPPEWLCTGLGFLAQRWRGIFHRSRVRGAHRRTFVCAHTLPSARSHRAQALQTRTGQEDN